MLSAVDVRTIETAANVASGAMTHHNVLSTRIAARNRTVRL